MPDPLPHVKRAAEQVGAAVGIPVGEAMVRLIANLEAFDKAMARTTAILRRRLRPSMREAERLHRLERGRQQAAARRRKRRRQRCGRGYK